MLPRTHGSALFTGGETQALVVATLGTDRDAQVIRALEGEYRQPFLLHYNFPPYSVGEIGQVGSPKRREVGHGRLAKRECSDHAQARPVPIPVRIVSEITESNGSSSMASVCGASLALMDIEGADQGAGSRDCDGADQEGEALRGANRYHRR